MIVEVPEIAEVLNEVRMLRQEIDQLKNRNLPEWMDLEEACQHKGVIMKTTQNHRYLMPDLSKREKVGRRYKWPWAAIISWAPKNDEVLKAEYYPESDLKAS